MFITPGNSYGVEHTRTLLLIRRRIMAIDQKKLALFWNETEVCNLTKQEAIEILKKDGWTDKNASITRRLEMLPERRLSMCQKTNLILNEIWNLLDKLGWDVVDDYSECSAKTQARLVRNRLIDKLLIDSDTPIKLLQKSGFKCTRKDSFIKFRYFIIKTIAIRNTLIKE